ncbi:hypothetical protein OUY22_11785 [Nonomuraea sp. MCN248]|uniref:Uncharacterized protein n=1 Tax=Nonomuraea corallina TaxID=2989783 RepID=A0ABT4SAL1_9ACTN|nr:hypothetical protein [Nonomuraea corallina]MDA0634098.1 hypothetical protein [Nonomuraea corallina]
MIFHDGPERMRRARELVAGRPGEPVAELLRVTRASLEAAHRRSRDARRQGPASGARA